MRMQTASEAISFSKELEEKAATFYEKLAQKFPKNADDFRAFAQENRKFFQEIHRSYVGVITDAIEGSYAVNLESDEYDFDAKVPESADLSELVQTARKIEDRIINYYEMAAEQSQSLMADVPRTFRIVIKKRRNKRLPRLDALK